MDIMWIFGPEYIDRLIVGILIALAVWELFKQLLRFYAPKTETKIDDKLVELINKFEGSLHTVTENEFIKKNSSRIWLSIETFSRSKIGGAVPALRGAQKLAIALVALHEAYTAATGKELSQEAIELFEKEMEKLSKATVSIHE